MGSVGKEEGRQEGKVRLKQRESKDDKLGNEVLFIGKKSRPT